MGSIQDKQSSASIARSLHADSITPRQCNYINDSAHGRSNKGRIQDPQSSAARVGARVTAHCDSQMWPNNVNFQFTNDSAHGRSNLGRNRIQDPQSSAFKAHFLFVQIQTSQSRLKSHCDSATT